MTTEEFKNTKFRALMKVAYKGKEYNLISVNFAENLVAINIDTDEDLYWIRCENCEIIGNIYQPELVK